MYIYQSNFPHCIITAARLRYGDVPNCLPQSRLPRSTNTRRQSAVTRVQSWPLVTDSEVAGTVRCDSQEPPKQSTTRRLRTKTKHHNEGRGSAYGRSRDAFPRFRSVPLSLHARSAPHDTTTNTCRNKTLGSQTRSRTLKNQSHPPQDFHLQGGLVVSTG